MSRRQWWSLAALLAVVVGLLCGPVGAVSAAEDAGGAGGAVTVTAAPADATTTATARADATATATASAVAYALKAGDPDPGPGIPGCGKSSDHDSEPAVPSRARAAYDQAPGLAPWGLPVATGAPEAEPPGIRARAPVPYTPTPVELSVLRV
ncbi:hypothetical protein RI138_17225 [Streptomyces sp. C11-1]|uniref:Secreted protein n=1 Tax=Streptomyces durocortorensis TaxID=2811104 RepID=A0ABY9VXD7_9ACTN|nr:hypothetical protein [Streptomyces durocortorensis]WNF28443.1 hypothetical protein RI138_17225 [Streptomyces durocortorensis]